MIAEQTTKKQVHKNKERAQKRSKQRSNQNQVLDQEKSNRKLSLTLKEGKKILIYASIVLLSAWLFYAVEQMPAVKWQVISSYIIVMTIITLRSIENKKITKKPISMQMTITDVLQKINILEGYYTTSEAADIINQFIDVKINHHKLQILSLRIGNENARGEYHTSRIAELLNEKEKLKSYLNEARRSGKQVQMNADVEITFI